MYTKFSLLAGYGHNQCHSGFACGYALTSVVNLWNSTPSSKRTDRATTFRMLSLLEKSYASGLAPLNKQFDPACAESLASCLGDLMPGYTPGECGADGGTCFQLSNDNTLVYWSQNVSFSDATGLFELADWVDIAAEIGGPLLDYAAATASVTYSNESPCESTPTAGLVTA